MSIADLMESMAEKGASLDVILLAVRAVEAEQNERAEIRARDAERSARYRSRRRMSQAAWEKLARRIISRDGKCAYCGSTADLTCDHVIPLMRGGDNDPTNLAAACRPCNSSKGDLLLSEWRR